MVYPTPATAALTTMLGAAGGLEAVAILPLVVGG